MGRDGDEGTGGDAGRPVVAAFDFDGTLASRRSTVGFARRLAPPGRLAAVLVRAVLTSLPRPSRLPLKIEVFGRLLRGMPAATVDAVARDYAAEIVRSTLHRGVVERAAEHRAAGHRLLVVTAGFVAYTRPVAEHLGFDDVIGTVIEVEGGVCTGVLRTPGLRGPAKARALREWVEAHAPGAEVHAYGDTAADHDMLAWARATRTPARPPAAAEDR